MALPVLAQSGYVPAGAYLGRLTRPKPSGSAGFTRQPCFMGGGNRLKYQKNVRFVRSYVQNETVTFSGVTYLAPLAFLASGDKSKAQLYKSNGQVVPIDKWSFQTFSGGGYTQVSIAPEVFDASATYKFDYQSVSRSVKDPLPFADLREILFVGDSESQKKYVEGEDFIVNTSITQPVADAANPNDTPSVSTITFTGTGTGTVAFNASNGPTYKYNRAYLLEATAAAGVSPTRTATIRVTAVALGGGNGTVPDQTVANEGFFTLSLDETIPSSLTNVDLGNGIKVDFSFGATNFVVADTFAFDNLGGARLELDVTLENTNQFASIDAPVAGPYTTQPQWTANAGTGTVAVGTDADYTGTTNRRYELEVTAAAGVSPTRTATIRWRALGELAATTGTISLVEATPASLVNVTLELGVKLTFTFGVTHFTVGDMFKFEARAPRTLYSGKDDRNITATLTASVGGATPIITYTWISNTKEGGSGTVVAAQQDVRTLLRNNLFVLARNLKRTSMAAYHAVGDKHTFSALSADTIDWTLQKKLTETIASTSVLFDQTGAVTGTIGLYYIIVANKPDSIISVKNSGTGAAIAYSSIAGTPYITFTTNPAVNIQVVYLTRGLEPDPGNSYFVTATQLRPTSDYNSPIQILSKDDADLKLGPMAPDNDVLIGALLGFENGMPSGWVSQARDLDEDGVIQPFDYQQAIDGAEVKSDITDLVPLGAWSVLGYAKDHVVKMNDPFKRRPRMGWFGAPINTPIGDQDTSGSLVYTAKQVLQVFGNSPAHGKFVLVGNTFCKVTILLPDDSTTQVTKDGSFVAAALCARVASFTDPGETPLKKDLVGFDEIDDPDDNELRLLGAAGITSVDVIGTTFRIVESLTTDPSADFSEISWITQDEGVVRTVNADVELATIGVVPPTAAEGADIVGNAVMLSLARQAARGTIAPYQDENGNVRKVKRGTDLIVEQDPVDKTKMNYLFSYFRKNPIKRVFGLYVTDVSDVSSLLSNA